MKKKITFLELLQMMKEGKAPKKVCFDRLEWVLNESIHDYYHEVKSLSEYYGSVMSMGEFVEYKGIIYEETILTDKEKAYLTAVLKPFKEHKMVISKDDATDGYNIVITAGDVEKEYHYFPVFPYESEMYKGMEVDKKYTPSELGLWEEE